MSERLLEENAQVILPAPYDRADWLKTRMQGVGGSDAAVAAGVSPWKSARELWLEKRGLINTDLSEEGPESPIYWGHALEDDVAVAFAQTSNRRLTESPGLLQNRQRPWQLASPDRFVWDGPDLLGILECKTTGLHMANEWAEGELPLPALMQTQHYLAVTGLEKGWIAGLIAGQRFVVKEVFRDEALIRKLTEAEERFWACVTDGIPPAPDGSASAREALRRQYPQATVEEGVLLNSDQLRDVQSIRTYDAQIHVLQRLREEAVQRLKAALGERPAGYDGDQAVVRWANRAPVRRWDTKRLEREIPDLVEDYTYIAAPTRAFTLPALKESNV